jgi:transposase
VAPEAHAIEVLESWAQGGAARAALRARIVLLSAAGHGAAEVSAQLGVGIPTVYKWCKRFRKSGLAGLVDLPRSGQPRRLSAEKRAEVVRVTTQEPPLRGSRWTIRTLARSLGVTQHQVRQIWAEAGLRPHETSAAPVGKVAGSPLSELPAPLLPAREPRSMQSAMLRV